MSCGHYVDLPELGAYAARGAPGAFLANAALLVDGAVIEPGTAGMETNQAARLLFDWDMRQGVVFVANTTAVDL